MKLLPLPQPANPDVVQGPSDVGTLVPETIWRLVGTGAATGNEVEPTVRGEPPSGFGTVAVSVAVPVERPLTTTPVLEVNVPVGLTIAAELVMVSEIGVELFEGVTVAVVVAVWPTATPEILENETLGVGVTLSPPLGVTGLIGQVKPLTQICSSAEA